MMEAEMARIRRCLLLLIVVGLALAGCAKTAGPFNDDFSDRESGWGAETAGTHIRVYQMDKYAIEVSVPDFLVWVTPGKVYQDVKVAVTAFAEIGTDNHYGVLCRYTQGEFYYFAISADGYYAIFRRTAGEDLIPLTGPAMLRSSVIATDGAENQLLAICDGSDLLLYVNGELVAQARDETLKRGDVGLAAGTLDQEKTRLWFDDFSAEEP